MVDTQPAPPADPGGLPGPSSAPLDRPAAARVAADRFATDLPRAVRDFTRLTGRSAPLNAEEREELEAELLALARSAAGGLKGAAVFAVVPLPGLH